MLRDYKLGGKQLTHHASPELDKQFLTYGDGVLSTGKMEALLPSILLSIKFRPAYESNSYWCQFDPLTFNLRFYLEDVDLGTV